MGFWIQNAAAVRSASSVSDAGDPTVRLNAAQNDLEAKLDAALTEEAIKTLVVDDKWLAVLDAAVQCELDRVPQTLTGRIRQVAEHYATPLLLIVEDAAALTAKVEARLKKMGAKP